ncbi:Fc.00g007510.m01.CDS01 [Cosmosporella sp. VM-42]
MTDQGDKKGFWGGLLRRASAARRASASKAVGKDGQEQHSPQQQQQQQQQPRRASDGDTIQLRRRRTMPESRPSLPPLSARRRPRRPSADYDQAKPQENGHGTNGRAVRFEGPGLLSSWPPSGMSSQEELPPQHALELIARGVPSHKGHKRAIPHAEGFYALYTTSVGNRGEGVDVANLHDSMTQFMTLRMLGPGHATYPWETLEQPSRAFYFGQMPGTLTLNQWASMASVLPPTIALRDSGVAPRVMSLDHIFERLQELRFGLEDDDEDLLYRILYKRILRDPDKILSPHKTLDKQITDLILVLSRPEWIDFTNPRNQVVTRFIFDTSEENTEQYHKFFHQLLLSLELEMRIQSHQHGDWAKEKLLHQIPPTIQWGLALARRWRDHVRVDDFGKTPEDVLLRYKLKKRQVKMLKRFAQMMKWPNLADTLDNLKRKDSEMALDDISSDAFAFFSGLVLPGPTFPFLIMNTLLDLDPDSATDDLALLSHIHPHCGFQYRNSYTYWSASCIVGKVLAPTCHSVAGWVGPGRPTSDLGRSQIARIRSRRPKQRMTPEDVESMGERSDPLGPAAEVFPIHEYKLATPALDDPVDTVRVELLSLKGTDRPDETTMTVGGPRLFDATVQFAIDGVSWPLRLMYDVSFISAWPCSDGPHPLFFDYVYESIKVDTIVGVRDWGGLYGGPAANSVRSSPGPAMMREGRREHLMHGFYAMGPPEEEEDDDEKVLVVEAFGVRDNEVLARAWCSHWGLSAVVADVRRTCMACAIREAYAATLTVVILVEGQEYERDE